MPSLRLHVEPTDSIPFPGHAQQQPTGDRWQLRLAGDSVRHAEAALEQAEQQMARLKALLGEEFVSDDPDRPRAA